MTITEGIDPQILERFELTAIAGTGGMGTVYRARERATGRVVALKMLTGVTGDSVRLAREIEVLSSLEHPGIVRYIDGGATELGAPFLVMEWLAGQDLGRPVQRLRPHGLPQHLLRQEGQLRRRADRHLQARQR